MTASSTTDTRIRLIADADDMGCCSSANRAFRDAFQKGILRNGNILIVGDACDEAVAMLKEMRGFCLGLHVTVTCEWNTRRWKPLLPPERTRSFIEPDGTMRRSVMAIHETGARFDEMLTEFQAQLDKARRCGLEITYVSSHMDPSWLFETSDEHRFGDVVAAWAQKEGLVLRNKYFTSRLPKPPATLTDAIDRFVWRLRHATPGLYLTVTHPAYDDDELRGMCYEGSETPGAVARERDMDRRMYMDERVLAVCRERNIELATYADLRAEG
jgi:hypothetical protein